MNISVRPKKKVTEMDKPDLTVWGRKEVRLSEMVDYHLLICRL